MLFAYLLFISLECESSQEKEMCSLLACKRSLFTLLIKICIVKVMTFPVVMYRCESWTIKMAECRRNWCFRTVVLEKTLGSPLDCKEIKPVNPKGNQLWIFTGRTDDEAEFLILWPSCEELIHWKRPWWWERLKAAVEGGNRRWNGWMASPTQWTSVWANSGRWWRTGKPAALQQSMRSQRFGHNWVTEQEPVPAD